MTIAENNACMGEQCRGKAGVSKGDARKGGKGPCGTPAAAEGDSSENEKGCGKGYSRGVDLRNDK